MAIKSKEEPKNTSLWPDEAKKRYEFIGDLGKGGFATVSLARRRFDSTKIPDLVAIKLVNAKTNTENNYAHREVQILQELRHSHIVELIEYWEHDRSSDAVAMVLTYARGKTLEFVLKNVGAPSLSFCRVVIAQLVNAVAYLHSQSVIHRDIKPDNIIINNISLDDKALLKSDLDDCKWQFLAQKWHLTLVDFGFARALSRTDLKAETALKKSIGQSMHHSSAICVNEVVKDSSFRFVQRQESIHTPSKSRRVIRGLSAVGNRDYAAPEVKSHIRKSNITQDTNSVNATLGSFVSDYGMVADAFSVGATARYTLTGVPPHENVTIFVSNYNSLHAKALRWVIRKVIKQSDNRPKKTYCYSDDIPTEALHLIKGMTHPNANERMSVRDARCYPYITDVCGETTLPSKETKFLPFVSHLDE